MIANLMHHKGTEGIGFIQIESVKSVVKKSGVGFGCGFAAPGSWFN